MAPTALLRPSSVPSTSELWEHQPPASPAMVGNDYISAGLAEHLHSFYTKASPEDRDRCMKLITALENSKGNSYNNSGTAVGVHRSSGVCHVPKPPKRPKTAMATIGSTHVDPRSQDVYLTKYKREYTPPPHTDTTAIRPSSTQNTYQAAHDLSGPVGHTTYDQEYPAKPMTTAQPIRTGSASGDRRNNPHPHSSFMNWRLSSHGKTDPPTSWAPQLTDDDFDRVIRGQLKSTYQYDYTGNPLGVKPPGDDNLPPDWKSSLLYSVESDQRRTYQNPKDVQPQFPINNTRYGCNRLKQKPSIGCVPNISDRYLHIKSNTTYEREYIPRRDLAPQSTGYTSHRVGGGGGGPGAAVGGGGAAERIQRWNHYYDSANQRDRDMLSRMIRTGSRAGSGSSRISSTKSARCLSPGYNVGYPSAPPQSAGWTSTF